MKYYILFFIFLFIWTTNANTVYSNAKNNVKFDISKNKLIQKESYDALIIKKLNKDIDALIDKSNIDDAITMCQKFLKLELENNTKGIIHIRLSELFLINNNEKEASLQLDKSLSLINEKTNFNYLKKIRKSLVKFQYYKKSNTALLRGLDYAKQTNLPKNITSAYLNLGKFNFDIKNHDIALDYFNKALKTSTKANNKIQMGLAYNNIASVELLNKNFSEVLKKLIKSRELLSNKASKNIREYTIDHNIAALYIETNQIEKATPILEKVRKFALETANTELLTASLITEGELYVKKKKITQAITLYLEALKHATISDNKYLITEINLNLTDLYEIKKNYKESLRYFKAYKEIYDTTNKDIAANGIKVLKTKLDINKYKSDLQLKEKEVDVLKLKKKQSNYLFTLLGLLILFLGFSLFRQFKIKAIKKKNNKYLTDIAILKEINLNKEVEFKDKQVTDFAIQIQDQNNVLLKLKNQLNLIAKKPKEKLPQEIKNISYDINSKIELNCEKVELNTTIEEYSQKFLLELKKQFPKLNKKEVKVCTLIRLNYNTKQIANQLNIGESSTHNYRYTIRKKLNLERKLQLDPFLKSL